MLAETEADATEFEEGVVFVESAGARQVEQQISVLHPHIEADVAASAGHGVAGVLAGAIPDDVAILQ